MLKSQSRFPYWTTAAKTLQFVYLVKNSVFFCSWRYCTIEIMPCIFGKRNEKKLFLFNSIRLWVIVLGQSKEKNETILFWLQRGNEERWRGKFEFFDCWILSSNKTLMVVFIDILFCLLTSKTLIKSIICFRWWLDKITW